jgi:hypothetical protein
MKFSVPASLRIFDYPRLFMMVVVTMAMGMIIYSTLFGVFW